MIDLLGEYALADMAYLACLETHGGLVLCEDIEGVHQYHHNHNHQEISEKAIPIDDHIRQRAGVGEKGSEGFVSVGPCMVSARALWLIESGRFETLHDHLDECEHYYGLLAQHAG